MAALNKNFLTAKFLIYSIFFVFVILATIFAFYDLQISKAVVDQNSVLGIFIEGYGEIPGFIVVVSAFAMANARLQKSFTSILPFIINSFVACLVLLYMSWMILYHVLDHISYKEILQQYPYINMILWSASITFVLVLSCLFRHSWANFVKANELYIKITLQMAIFVGVLVQALKTLWGRVRFRDLSSDVEFTAWYLPQGITGSHSFPSGHTFIGWMVLPLFLVFLSSDKHIRVTIAVLLVSWGILVAVGRVIIGAHYASDVLFATTFSSLFFLFLYHHYTDRSIAKT